MKTFKAKSEINVTCYVQSFLFNNRFECTGFSGYVIATGKDCNYEGAGEFGIEDCVFDSYGNRIDYSLSEYFEKGLNGRFYAKDEIV
jgi:hypothetical protein